MWIGLNIALTRKAQVTAFVILGLVVFFSIIMLVFITSSNNTSKANYEFRKYSGPVDRGQIQSYVEGCIQSVVKPAVYRMASQGGYINVPVDFYLPQIPVTGINPRMVQAVAPLTRAKLVNVPYAYYNGEDHFPTIEEMEEELSYYVTVETDRCLDKFKAFNYDLDFTEKTPLEIKTTIAEEKISFNAKYDIEFKSKDKKRTFSFNTFRGETNLRLGKLRELARQIVNYQAESHFLENTTTEILAFSELPYEGLEFSCADKKWLISDLESTFKKYLTNNLPYIRLENTRYNQSEFYRGKDGTSEYYSKNFAFHFTDDDFSDVRVDTYYNDYWDLNMDVYPKNNGNIVKPLKVGIQSYFMCVKTYHHRYDFNFPVMFRLIDTYKDETLVFNLAVPVSIRKNQPFKNDLYVPYGNVKKQYSNEEYCTEDELLYPIEIRAYDDENEEFVSNVSLDYSCGIYTCENVGYIDYPRRGNLRIAGKNPSFNGKLPECTGGLLTLRADGYEDTTEQINTLRSDTSYNRQSPFIVNMKPKKSFEYTVKIITDVNNPLAVRDLVDGELAIVTITDQETNKEQTAYYPSDVEEYQKLSITQLYEPKKYTVDVKIFKSNPTDIEPEDIFRNGKIIGGFFLGDITYSFNELSNYDSLTLYAVTTTPVPQNTEEFYTFFERSVMPVMNTFKPVLS
jgi:hypothetical protein